MRGTRADWVGTFGELWVEAACVASGQFQPSRPTLDRFGYDLLLGDDNGEAIRVQVKTTEAPTFVGDELVFDLDIPTYNRLRSGNAVGFLVVIVLHKLLEDAHESVDLATMVHATGYWSCLANADDSPNTSTIALKIPIANRLAPADVVKLFEEAAKWQ